MGAVNGGQFIQNVAVSDDPFHSELPPSERPGAYYGETFLDDLILLRKAGASPEELIDKLCLADLGPILDEPTKHSPHYVNLLTTSTPRLVAEGSLIYDRYNDEVLQAILVGSPLDGNVEARRTLRIAFAMNAHGVLVEAIKGEDGAELLHVSRLMRVALLRQLISDFA